MSNVSRQLSLWRQYAERLSVEIDQLLIGRVRVFDDDARDITHIATPQKLWELHRLRQMIEIAEAGGDPSTGA